LKNIIRSEDGISLIEVIIAAAIAIVIALSLADMMVSTNKRETLIKQKQDIYNDQQQLRYENKIIPLPSPI
jgi:Tfp pilus assembly protein PilV